MRVDESAEWVAVGGVRVRPISLRDLAPRLLAWLVPIGALLVVYAVVLYQREADSERRIHEQESLGIVDVGTEIVGRDLESVIADLRYLADQTVLRDFLGGVPQARFRLEDDFWAFCVHKAVYDQVRLLHVDGMEAVRVNYNRGTPIIVPEAELQSKLARDYFSKSVDAKPGDVDVSPFDVNVEHGEIERPLKPVIRFATPVFLERRVAGVLVLNYLGERLLRKVREISSGFSGEVALINDDGFYLLHPRSPRAEWAFQVGPGPTFASDHPVAWQSVSAQSAGQVLTSHGLFTFRRISSEAAPRRGLTLISHLPREQLQQGADALLGQVVSIYSLAGPLLLALSGYLAYAGAVRKRHHEQIAESEARLRTLSAQLLTAQERERAGLSRDLHDDLGQWVTTVRLDLERATRATDPREKNELLQLAMEAAGGLMSRVRAISARLRPRILDDLGLKEATRSFLAECRERFGLEPEIDLRFEREEIPRHVSENVYRILQEAVTNVAKHAEVKELSVDLVVSEGGVRLQVRDAGKGFDPQAVESAGLGLLGMRERVELLGGRFRLRSRSGGGYRDRGIHPVATGVTSEGVYR